MANPTLPQYANATQAAERQRALAWARTQYTWSHSHSYEYDGQTLVFQPIAVLEVDDQHPLPPSQQLNAVQILDILDTGLDLLSNMVVNVTNLFGVGAVALDPPPPADFQIGDASWRDATLKKIRGRIEHALDEVVEIIDDVRALREAPDEVKTFVDTLEEQREALEELTKDVHDDVTKGGKRGAQREHLDRLGSIFEDIIEALIHSGLEQAGLYGPATALRDYADQFQTVVVPDVVSQTMSDALFARMRVAGPNPLLIRKIDALPSNFPVDPARFEARVGLSPDDALADDRVYLVDYRALETLEPGDFPAGQKYITPGLALFALVGEHRLLEPVAIQCGQTPGNSTPIFYPDDGEGWELAKLHIQTADGNYHELISHLGLTHFLVEPFAVATHRNLAQNHPVYLLLLPHFQGTLFINNAAVTSLVAPGGTVDKLLAGTIESDWALTSQALGALDFNAHMLPEELARRGVMDSESFPGYPYRDDALLSWSAIESWVRDYLAIYYNDDAAVTEDSELQAWYRDLVSPEGGCVGGLGELGPDDTLGLFTFDYLARVLTMVIFTGSVQHASVNFPQKQIMSYTPAMPLAAYAPAPTQTSGPASDQTTLAELPPLQMGMLQVLIGQLLGGVYFTRLGDYDRHQSGQWFTDARVGPLLEDFQAELVAVEREIGRRNLSRPCYEFLLPSRIPQSINI
ncbi:lipoxygenase [Pseudenhygromyxa sp. WMMC2535]|uniref:lipoxygenase family protein n=1 Tax=Pseudenhygromyxa sp. WMMC2535 TaxID=2712867 RepID=UPI0015561233|nr:lipoxygenase family protein [Pseudenhygromyxa sp. WMMC2535]NVB38527.1 lipoxygenase [Pseudenhygromyxa sp. WMMC2535]